MTWLFIARQQRDLSPNGTTEAARNNNQTAFCRLSIIWALPHQGRYFVTFSLSKIATADGARHSTLTSHMICVAASHRAGLKINLSCQQAA